MEFSPVISVETLSRHLDDPDWRVVDCRFSLDDAQRGRRDYAADHIPGAVYAHLDEDLSGPVAPGRTGRHPLPAVDTVAARFATWGIGSGTQVVAYDDSGGGIAARLWWLLHWLGHARVAVLDGGYPAWLAASLPVTAALPETAPRTFTPRPRPELWVTAEDVLTHFGDPTWKLVDSRAPERYRGENEPIDPVAGRIPGALNYFWQNNLDKSGHFRPPEVLRGRFTALLGAVPAEQTIFYCGSGVTAAFNVLAVAYAGLGLPRLYAGSWSEWITDPERPITAGK